MIRRAVLLSILVFAMLSPMPAVAVGSPQLRQVAACGASVASFLGLEPWWSCLEKKHGNGNGQAEPGEVRLEALNDIWLIVLVILEDVIKVGGYIAVGFIIWGGIKYTKSQGNPGELQQAQAVIKNAILGLVITLVSVAIVQFVVRGLAT